MFNFLLKRFTKFFAFCRRTIMQLTGQNSVNFDVFDSDLVEFMKF